MHCHGIGHSASTMTPPSSKGLRRRHHGTAEDSDGLSLGSNALSCVLVTLAWCRYRVLVGDHGTAMGCRGPPWTVMGL